MRMESGPTLEASASGSCLLSLIVGLWLSGTSSLPLAPLLSALVRARKPAARWGPSFWWGAANLASDLGRTKRRNAVRPIATVVLNFHASHCSILHPTIA
jgi:hypothetical protein